MMKTVVALLILLMGSGGVLSWHEQIHCASGCEPITVINNRIVMKALLNGQESQFIITTARPSISRLPNPRPSQTIANNLIVVSNKNLPVGKLPDFDWCPNNAVNVIVGTFGSEYFGRSHATFIDFDTMQVCFLSGDEIEKKLSERNYRAVRSRFNGDSFSIALSINWKTYYFQFDTTYDGAFSMPFSQKLPFLNEQHVKWHSKTANNVPIAERLYFNKAVWLEGIGYNSSISTTKEHQYSVGLQFIQGFNWIIDYDGKKVYCQKNESALNSGIEHRDYKLEIVKGELHIVKSAVSNAGYEVGSVITHVNGAEVTIENVCDLKIKLAHVPSWDNMTITVASRDRPKK